MLELFRPSGGVLYHLRARHRRHLWRGFTDQLGGWLKTWPITQQELILIGPSGGYSLPDNWLRAFSQVQAFDVDPLVPWLFQRRHPHVKTHFYKQDMFWRNGQLSLKPIDKVLNASPQAAILFCNILGQIPLERAMTEDPWYTFLKQLRERLNGRSWASYHDLYTVEPLPLPAHEEVAASDNLRHALRSLKGSRYEVVDHLMTGSWSAGLTKSRFAWSLTPNSLHIIEGVRSPD